MNILSLFDGISCGYLACQRAGIQIDNYFASEIDKYAEEISKKNFPNIVRTGDVKWVSYDELNGYLLFMEKGKTYPQYSPEAYYTSIDLLIGGSPCQDLSIANKNGKGLEGERSSLFFEYVRILREVKPKYFLFENVASMKQKDRDIITKELGVEPILINSSLVSAQNRKRLYWVGQLQDNGTYLTVDIPQPEDKKIHLKDIIEDIPMDDSRWKPIDEKYLTPEGKIRIAEATKLGYIEPEVGDCVDMTQPNSKTRRGRLMKSDNKTNALCTSNQYYVIGEKSRTITASYSKGAYLGNLGTHRERTLVINDLFWRDLTVRECARLQTIYYDFIFPVSTFQAKKAIGNAWTVDVIAHILSFIITLGTTK